MARHPRSVPHQHHHGSAEHACIEEFLTRAFECVSDGFREQRDNASPERAGEYPGRHPSSPPVHTTRRGEDDPDDQPRFDHFTEYDDERAEHAVIPR